MNLMWTISEFYFIRISIVIWRVNGLSRIKNVDANAGHKLCELIDKVDNEFYPIVLDFNGVVALTDGSMSAFFEKVIKSKKEVHFINCEPLKAMIRGLFDEFKAIDSGSCLFDFDNRLIIFNGQYQLNDSSLNLTETAATSLDELIKNIVKNSFVPNDSTKQVFKPLSSTPILATGQFDAASIISNPNHFTLVCIRLADFVQSLIEADSILNAKLLSVSLRASPFANAVSLLLNIQMRTIDHLGPFQKVWDFESFDRYSLPNTNYIFIGDFIVGGTEMKLAHLFAKYCQSDLKHAVVIGTLFDPSRFVRYKVRALISLKDLNLEAKHKLFE